MPPDWKIAHRCQSHETLQMAGNADSRAAKVASGFVIERRDYHTRIQPPGSHCYTRMHRLPLLRCDLSHVPSRQYVPFWAGGNPHIYLTTALCCTGWRVGRGTSGGYRVTTFRRRRRLQGGSIIRDSTTEQDGICKTVSRSAVSTPLFSAACKRMYNYQPRPAISLANPRPHH